MAGVHDEKEIEGAISQFAAQPNGGMVVLPDATIGVHARLIIELAERHHLPAVYSSVSNARAGGLIAYSDSTITMFQSAASYADRLLRGAKVSDLPIQAVDRFETVINLKTAAKLGITVPSSLLSAADDVIE
jgi:putative ABC transport system substrate-binding protein